MMVSINKILVSFPSLCLTIYTENTLGISRNKLRAIVERADVNKSGNIDYQKFLETVSSYRLTTEQASKVTQVGTAFAYAEEFTCRPPKLFIALGKL